MNKVETIITDIKLGKESELKEANAKMKKLIKDYNTKGYKVVSTIPLTSGEFDLDSYSFGYTSGIMVVFEKV